MLKNLVWVSKYGFLRKADFDIHNYLAPDRKKGPEKLDQVSHFWLSKCLGFDNVDFKSPGICRF